MRRSSTGSSTIILSRCASIVSNLLDYSRRREVQYGAVDTRELLEKCIMLSRHKLELENIRTETRMDEKTPMAWGDFNQLQQCVINLVFNAIDAMEKGGTLTTGCTYNAKMEMVEIMVADTGRGISPEKRKSIFAPFYTTKQEGKGLGLGLSTVAKIDDQHNGTIDVESEPGKGTLFPIRLPAASKSGL